MNDSNIPNSCLPDRVAALRAWAESRMKLCLRQEAKLAQYDHYRLSHPPQALIEAWTERRTLQKVLEMLDVELSAENTDDLRAQLKRARVMSLKNAILVCRWRGNFWGTADPVVCTDAARAWKQELRKERLLHYWLQVETAL